MEYRCKISKNISWAVAMIDFIFEDPFGEHVSQLKIETNKKFRNLFINGFQIGVIPEEGETSFIYTVDYTKCLPTAIEGIDNSKCGIVAYLDIDSTDTERIIKITPILNETIKTDIIKI
jgi:hypothetical protein